MKQSITVFILIFPLFLFAQKIGVQQFEYVSQLKSLEEKTDFISGKGFAKKGSENELKFVRKAYIKRTQEFDEEIITIQHDTIVYSLIDPKKFAVFKKAIESHYSKSPESNFLKGKLVYKKKRYTIVLKEVNRPISNDEISKTYSFSIVNNN